LLDYATTTPALHDVEIDLFPSYAPSQKGHLKAHCTTTSVAWSSIPASSARHAPCTFRGIRRTLVHLTPHREDA
jgi:hypothetical protein